MPSHCECACDSYRYFIDDCEITEAEKEQLKGIANFLKEEINETTIKEGYGNYRVEIKIGNKLSDSVKEMIHKRQKAIKKKKAEEAREDLAEAIRDFKEIESRINKLNKIIKENK